MSDVQSPTPTILDLVTAMPDMPRANTILRMTVWHRNGDTLAQEWLRWTGLGAWFEMAADEREEVLGRLGQSEGVEI